MKLFFPTQEQNNVLLGLIRDCAQKLIDTNFNVPAQDEENIRHHAYVKGKLEVLKQLLNDDFEIEQPKQQQE